MSYLGETTSSPRSSGRRPTALAWTPRCSLSDTTRFWCIGHEKHSSSIGSSQPMKARTTTRSMTRAAGTTSTPFVYEAVMLSRADRPSLYFSLTAPDGSQVYPRLPDGTDGRWRWSQERVERDAHLIEWINGGAGWTPGC